MRLSSVAFATLAIAAVAVAQTGCPPPVVRVFSNNQEVPRTGAAFASKVPPLVSPSPACADQVRYRLREADVALLRGRRPLLPAKLVRRPEADLTDLMSIAQPGDRGYVFVRYENLAVVSADGKLNLYPRPEPGADKPNTVGAALVTDAARGIGFNWLLVQK